jgi:hypothetical protein
MEENSQGLERSEGHIQFTTRGKWELSMPEESARMSKSTEELEPSFQTEPDAFECRVPDSLYFRNCSGDRMQATASDFEAHF